MENFNHSNHGENLIFLVSQPRAGSTMFQLMLSGSEEIATTSEPWIALHPIFATIKNGEDSIYNAELAKEALKYFLEASGSDFSFYNKQIAIFLQSLYNRAISYYGRKYFLDKTPRYYYVIDRLIEIFPEAKFLILFRNPLGVLSSILKTWVKDDLSFLCNFVDDLILAPQKLIDCLRRYPDRCFKIYYEEIVNDPEYVLKQTCEYLQIEYTGNMIDYSDRLTRDWKLGDQQGVYRFSQPSPEFLDKWKESFKSDQEKLLAHSYLASLGPKVIGEMGYDYDNLSAFHTLPENYTKKDLVPFETIMHIVQGVSNIKDIRRTAFYAILKEKFYDDLEYGNNDWSELFEKMVLRIIYPKINQLNEKINHLKQNIDHLEERKALLQNRIKRMEDTLSWKITAPLRNSKILKSILNTYQEIRNQ